MKHLHRHILRTIVASAVLAVWITAFCTAAPAYASEAAPTVEAAPDPAYEYVLNQYRQATYDMDLLTDAVLYPDIPAQFLSDKASFWGYAFYDVGGDGTQELLILHQDGTVIDAFTKTADSSAVRCIPFPAESNMSWYVMPGTNQFLLHTTFSDTAGVYDLWELDANADPVYAHVSGGQYEFNEAVRASYGASTASDYMSDDTYAAFTGMCNSAVQLRSETTVTEFAVG